MYYVTFVCRFRATGGYVLNKFKFKKCGTYCSLDLPTRTIYIVDTKFQVRTLAAN